MSNFERKKAPKPNRDAVQKFDFWKKHFLHMRQSVSEERIGAIIKTGQFKSVQKSLLDALGENPKDIFLLNSLMKMNFLAGQEDAAMQYFGQARRDGIDDGMTYNIPMHNYRKNGNLPRVQSIADLAICNGKAIASTFNILIYSYARVPDLGKAREVFKQAKEMGLANSITCTTLMDAYLSKSLFGEIETLVSEAPECLKNHWAVRLRVAQSLLKQGKPSEAMPIFLKVAHSNESPDHQKLAALVGMADALASLGKLEKSISILREAMLTCPNPPSPKVICRLVLFGGETEEEKHQFKLLLEKHTQRAKKHGKNADIETYQALVLLGSALRPDFPLQ